MEFRMLKKLIAFACLSLSISVNAATVYTYTGHNLTTAFGNPSYTLPDHVSLTLTLDDALAADLGSPVNLVDVASLSGFHLTMSSGSLNLDSSLHQQPLTTRVATDASGNISSWDFEWRIVHLKFGVSAGISTVGPGCELNDSNEIECFEGIDRAYDTFSGTLSGYSGPNGTWSVPSQVPLPAAAWLFGSALLGLAGFKGKKA
jgi:hypothetical protein